MRLIKAVPEIEGKIESGAINITVAAQVQKFFRQEAEQNKTASMEVKLSDASQTHEFSHAKKIKILQNLEGKSSRAVEQELFALSSEPAKIKHFERQRVVSAQLTEVSFLADAQLLKDLEKVKGLLAHHNLKSLAEVIAKMAELSIEKLDPSLKKTRVSKFPAPEVMNSNTKLFVRAKLERQNEIEELNKASRYVPVDLKKTVWARDKGQCSFIDPHTKRKCESIHRLQIDHIIPHACGGETTGENLRLLCFHHNQWAAQKVFGFDKMARMKAKS